MDKTWDRNP